MSAAVEFNVTMILELAVLFVMMCVSYNVGYKTGRKDERGNRNEH